MSENISDFVIAKLDNNSLVRFNTITEVPAGTSVITAEDLEDISIQEITEIYSSIAGTPPKKFRTRAIAVESLVQKIGEMPFHQLEPESVVEDIEAKRKYTRKNPNVFEILPQTPETPRKIEDIAPQGKAAMDLLYAAVKHFKTNRIEEKDLMEFFREEKNAMTLHTRQDPWRIFQYYRAQLTRAGIVVTH
jgi:hypothetical protein